MKVTKKKTNISDSPLRRSILETNEADDSSAAEDLGDERHKLARARPPNYTPSTELGDIQIGIHYDKNRSKLIVRLIQARGLINTDKDSLSDPYARLILMPDKKKRTKRKTRIYKDSLTPVWEEAFEFDMTLAEARMKTVDVVVKNDKSLFSREKTFMGECLISLESMFDLEFGNVDWYKLQDQSIFESIIKKIQD